MSGTIDVWQGTLALMVLKTVQAMKEARQWEQTAETIAWFLSPGEEPR